MATFRRVTQAAPALITMRFDSYNAAVGFMHASALLNPSKPFKKGMLWHVTMMNPAPGKHRFQRVDDWEKPGAYYDHWKGVEGLEGIPEPERHVAESQIGNMVHKSQEKRMVRVGWAPLPKHVYEQAAAGMPALPMYVYEQAHRMAFQ